MVVKGASSIGGVVFALRFSLDGAGEGDGPPPDLSSEVVDIVILFHDDALNDGDAWNDGDALNDGDDENEADALNDEDDDAVNNDAFNRSFYCSHKVNIGDPR